MLTGMRLRGFKSWKDTGDIALRPITGFFGANSSGKTSLLQGLLLLKQTAESSDRGLPFHFGNGQSLVDLGDFSDVVHRRDAGASVGISLGWTVDSPVEVRDGHEREVAQSDSLGFSVVAAQNGERAPQLSVDRMTHRVGGASFGMERNDSGYGLFAEAGEFRFEPGPGRPWSLPPPVRFYGFPGRVRGGFKNADFLSRLERHFERQLERIRYLGPLRAYPERRYLWTGARPIDMGRAGEMAVAAILAARARGDRISLGRGKRRRTLEEHVAHWLKELGLIHTFRIEPLVQGLFQVLVRETAHSAEVPITDVGFGVSQVLPVLVLCFYAPEGSTILLEQPEIHLHPSAQSLLVDAFIDARRRRNIQILVESHSEHVLRRLQRRVSDETLCSAEVGSWFCYTEGGESRLMDLSFDDLGATRHWPKGLFGDQFEEVAAIAKNRLRRSTDA